jgi:hypothetical protein
VGIVEGVLAAAVLLLFLVILAVMREAVILRGQVTALSQLIVTPPAPSFLGKPLPRPLARALAWNDGTTRGAPRPHIVLFVSAGCSGCTQLIADLRDAVQMDLVPADGVSCVVSAPSEDAPIFRAAQAVCRRAALDDSGALLDEGEVKGTPSLLAFWSDGREVFDYKIGGDVEWIRQKLHQRKEPTGANGTPPRLVLRETPFEREAQPADASFGSPAGSRSDSPQSPAVS